VVSNSINAAKNSTFFVKRRVLIERVLVAGVIGGYVYPLVSELCAR
jgi:hypothetical protein